MPMLRMLLGKYPPGIGLIKEFVQNADDAGASWIRFTLDLRQHPTSGPPDPRMAQLMGPALLISSDQVFDSDDLLKIESIGEGNKIGETQKTGQFGLGFNTAYAVTDYPAFATNDLVRCFDPIGDAVAEVAGDTGREWDLEELWRSWPDWPRAFHLAEGARDLDYTVFRLPLRTPSQVDRLDLARRRLCPTPFDPPDLEAIFAEVEELAGALLLFTRHVLHLLVDIVETDGRRKQRLSVRTTNAAAVSANRNGLLEGSRGPASPLLARWAEAPSACPARTYAHRFEVEGTRVREQSWWVAQAIEPGPHGEVLEAAHAMGAVHQKALPWVGAALLLSQHDGDVVCDAVPGRLYCTLPLPDARGLPFHVNGYWALDSSRAQPIHGSLRGDAQVRVEWNQALAAHAVPQVVTRLLLGLPEDVRNAGPQRLHDLWPDPDQLSHGLLRDLGTATVAALGRAPLVRVRGAAQVAWVPASRARAPAPGWTLELERALCDDGLPLPDPKMSPRHLRALDAHGLGPRRYQPPELRAWLTRSIDVPLEEAPLRCLRSRGLIKVLLRFFLSDGGCSLAALPLALTQAGRLRTFDAGKLLLLAGEELRRLFGGRPDWFIDHQLQRDLPLRPDDLAGLRQLTAALVPEALGVLVGRSADGLPIGWTPGEAGQPTSDWLSELFQYLSRQALPGAKQVLREVPLVPDQLGQLHPPFRASTPVIVPQQLGAEHATALRAVGAPIVGVPSLVPALLLVAQRHPGFVQALTADTVVHALATSPEGLAQLAWDDPTRAALLDLLVELDASSPMSERSCRRLATLRVWPTQDGQLLPALGSTAFVPTGFQPPPSGRAVEVFRTGTSGAWARLLRRLGARALQPSTYLRRVFAEYPELPVLEQRRALHWLATSGVLDQLDQESDNVGVDTRRFLRTARTVRCRDGLLHPMARLYHPEAEDAHDLLAEHAPVADMDFYGEPHEPWLSLFRRLGMKRKPKAEDLLARIRGLVATAEEEGAAVVTPPIQAVVEHLAKRWEELSTTKLDGRELVQHLAKLPWLPARHGADSKRVYGVFLPPDDRLFQPRELFTSAVGHLVASQAPLLATDRALSSAMMSALRIRSTAPLDLAVRHFLAVRDAWQTTPTLLTAAVVGETARMLYLRIGREVARQRVDRAQGKDVDPDRLLAARVLRSQPCVWVGDQGRFLLSAHTFAVPVPYFGSLRAHVPAEGPEAEGLRWLGRGDGVTLDDYRGFLDDLARTAGADPLDSDAIDSAIHALRKMFALAETGSGLHDLRVLSTDRRLRPAARVLLDDAPWWRHRLEDAPVALLHPEVPLALAMLCGVEGAAGSLREVLLVEPTPTEDLDSQDLCDDLTRHIKRPEFEAGLRRLVYQEHQVLDADVGACRGLDFTPCEPMATVLTGSPLAPLQQFGEETVRVHADGRRVYLAGADPVDVVPEVADLLSRALGENRLSNLAPLEQILSTPPAEIAERLDRRRVPRLPVEAESRELTWAEEEPPPGTSTDSVNTTESQDALPEFGAGAGVYLAAEPGGGWCTTSPSGVNGGRGQGSSRLFGEPSSLPGDGSPRRGKRRRQARLRTYLIPAGRNLAAVSEADRARQEAADRQAIAEAIAYEARAGRTAREMPADHPGYDLISGNASGADERVIEVKGLVDAWGIRGVSLNPAQVEAAREHGDRFWLYVVELALDADRARVYAIPNPVNSLSEFRLDGGWKARAEAEPETLLKPEVGLFLHLAGDLLGVIEEVEVADMDSGSSMSRLRVRPEGGESTWKVFRPSRHTLSREP